MQLYKKPFEQNKTKRQIHQSEPHFLDSLPLGPKPLCLSNCQNASKRTSLDLWLNEKISIHSTLLFTLVCVAWSWGWSWGWVGVGMELGFICRMHAGVIILTTHTEQPKLKPSLVRALPNVEYLNDAPPIPLTAPNPATPPAPFTEFIFRVL